MPKRELWTTEQVGAYLGIKDPNSQLRRWKIRPIGREIGRGGQHQYDAEQIRRRRPQPAQENP